MVGMGVFEHLCFTILEKIFSLSLSLSVPLSLSPLPPSSTSFIFFQGDSIQPTIFSSQLPHLRSF